jgi:hypothetical protein
LALRFQDKGDEVDRAAKDERATPVLVFLLVLIAAIQGVFSWIEGKSLASYGEDLAWLFALGLAYWFFAPFYYEFRIRTKEIDGKVSAIEKSVNSLRDGIAELRDQLQLALEKLDEILGSRRGASRRSDSEIYRELNGISEGLARLNKVERELQDEARLNDVRARDSGGQSDGRDPE